MIGLGAVGSLPDFFKVELKKVDRVHRLRCESLIFQYRFRIDRDFEDVTDDDAAFIHCVVPTDAKVLAID